MSGTAVIDEPEPFGQRGVRPLIRPILVGLCAIALAVSTAMWFRSQHDYDSLWRVTDNRAIEVASVMGRFMVTTRMTQRSVAPDEAWNYESQEYATMVDAWQPSVWKTLGVEWGAEAITGYGGRQITYWRFRLAWRTACIAAAVPLALDAWLRGRRRRSDTAFEVVPTSTT